MTAPAQCTLTELPVDGCAHCRPTPPRPAPAGDLTPDDVGQPFLAGYPGQCAVCDDDFAAGDLISPLRPYGSGYACEGCQP